MGLNCERLDCSVGIDVVVPRFARTSRAAWSLFSSGTHTAYFVDSLEG